jgi:hypothetical protein
MVTGTTINVFALSNYDFLSGWGNLLFPAFFFESLFSVSVSGSIEDSEGTFGMISSKGFCST